MLDGFFYSMYQVPYRLDRFARNASIFVFGFQIKNRRVSTIHLQAAISPILNMSTQFLSGVTRATGCDSPGKILAPILLLPYYHDHL